MSGRLTSVEYTHPETGILAKVHAYAQGKDQLRIMAVIGTDFSYDRDIKYEEHELLNEVKQIPCRFALVGECEGENIVMNVDFLLVAPFIHNPKVKCFDNEGRRWLGLKDNRLI